MKGGPDQAVTRTAIGLMVFFVGCVAQAADPGGPPERGAADAEAERQAFESLFGKDIKAAKATRDVRDDLDLAGRLLTAAKADSRPEFIALTTGAAYDLAAGLPQGAPTAAEAMRVLAAKVPASRSRARDRLLDLYQGLYTRGRGEEKAAAGEKVIDLLLETAEEQTEALDLSGAAATYRRALSVAWSMQGSDRASIQAALQAVVARQRHLAEVERLAASLKSNPADKAARDQIVRLYLVELDRPTEAAQYLDPADDTVEAKLVLLAGMTPARLPEAACLRLADWYQELADKAAMPARETMLLKARTYAETFLDKHTAQDPDRAKGEAALAAIEQKLGALPPKGPLTAGAVVLLTFDRDSFFRRDGKLYVRDWSGKGNHAAVTGARLGPGKVGSALVFDGNNDGADLGNAASLQITGNQTIAFWIKPARLGLRQNPYAKAYGGEGTMTLEPDGRVNYYYGTAGGNAAPYTSLTMTQDLKADAWAHLVLVRDQAKADLVWYRDGKRVADGKAAYPAAKASPLPAHLGRGYAGSFGGAMDEFVLYAKALSDREVQMLYGMGARGASLISR